MATRTKYEIDGKKVPSLKQVLDNVKIGGIGNLLYRANQAGLAGRQLQSKEIDVENAGWCALKQIDAILNGTVFDISNYSDRCIERAYDAVNEFIKFYEEQNADDMRITNNLTLVSEEMKFGDTFNVYNRGDKKFTINVCMHNNLYPEDLLKIAAQFHLLLANNLVCHVNFTGYILRINNPKTPDEEVTLTIHEYDDMRYPVSALKAVRNMYDVCETLKTLL